MKGDNDELMKPTDPLSPTLRVHDADKRGPSPPPRNKMALCEEDDNATSQHQGVDSGSSETPPTPASSSSQVSLFSTISLPVLRRAFLNQHDTDPFNENSKLSQDTEISSKEPVQKILANSNPVSPERIKVSSQDNGAQRITRKRRASEMDVPLHSEIETTNELSEYEESDDDFTSIPGLDLTPDDVVDVIGQRPFWKARNTILRQQRTFALQKFELHRLIKVQRLIAGSPEVLLANDFDLKKPSGELPPKDKDPEKESSTSKSSPTPASVIPRLQPWYFHPPGNQWLVPGKSPFLGPFPSPVGIMAPFSGNCGPINFGGASLCQSYFQLYAMPQMNRPPSGPNLLTDLNVRLYSGGDLNPLYGSEMQGISGSSDQNVRVIKVVPHINPRLAQESASGIFQSIQLERSKHDPYVIGSFSGFSSYM